MTHVPPHVPSSKARVSCGATALIYNENREVLMIRRTGSHGEGTWSVPGGWVDPGEDPRRTAERETWEEVGVQAHGLSFIDYSHTVFDEGVESVTLWFLAAWWEGTPRVAYPDRVSDIRWCAPDAIPSPLFKALEDFLAKGHAL